MDCEAQMASNSMVCLQLLQTMPNIVPLIQNFKAHIPQMYQPWYADDAGAAGTFANNLVRLDQI